jgi:aspartyl-tRNA(Asn)/glutamyl-tRNA(Gln) amidotransferase subunit A
VYKYQDYSDFRKKLNAGRETCTSTVEDFLNKIEERKHLNVFLEVFSDEALNQAKLIDQKISSGQAGRLAGMVISIKDNICYKGHKLSASSKILNGFESIYSSTVVERLLEEDAIIIGRTNCDEFAMGSSNENSAYWPVLNPLNEKLVPGGSSGGAAASVAAGFCHAALGSDTGGSIRQPASFTGTIGFRPTYGRISRHGLIAFASSFDQIGTITSNIYDTALLMEVIAGHDEYDSTVSRIPVVEYTSQLIEDIQFSFAYLDDCIRKEGIDPEIRDRILQIIKNLENTGIKANLANFPYLDHMIPVYYVLAAAEASSNLSRFTGVTYGYRSEADTSTLESTMITSRSEGFGPEVKRRIMLGTFVLSEGYYDAYYSKAQKVRRLITDFSEQLLNENDFILLPTAPTTAFSLGEIEDPISMYLADIYTIQSAVAGLPSISIPAAIHSNGMPYGIQIIGKRFKEGRLLAFSQYLMNKLKDRTL